MTSDTTMMEVREIGAFLKHLAVVQADYDIGTVQELLGDLDVSTTMIYTHMLNKGGKGVVSPLDR
jgi:site-specific recombinase XerD